MSNLLTVLSLVIVSFIAASCIYIFYLCFYFFLFSPAPVLPFYSIKLYVWLMWGCALGLWEASASGGNTPVPYAKAR